MSIPRYYEGMNTSKICLKESEAGWKNLEIVVNQKKEKPNYQ
jgi:hypothetical protein